MVAGSVRWFDPGVLSTSGSIPAGDAAAHRTAAGPDGLATPAAAGVLASLVLVAKTVSIGMYIPENTYKISLLITTGILGCLMVSQIRYLHAGAFLFKKRSLFLQMVVYISVLVLVVYYFSFITVLLSSAFLIYTISGVANELKIRSTTKNDDLASAH